MGLAIALSQAVGARHRRRSGGRTAHDDHLMGQTVGLVALFATFVQTLA